MRTDEMLKVQSIHDELMAEIERMKYVLGEIARGRGVNGRPLAAETSRQMARDVLARLGLQWPEHRSKTVRGEPRRLQRPIRSGRRGPSVMAAYPWARL